MKRTRVAIAGMGAATRNIHLPALRKLKDVEIVGVYDPAVATSLFPQFSNLNLLLDATLPEILIIATPPASHAETAIVALARGCHVFCEKPLTATIEEVDVLAAAAVRANRHVVVNSEFPFMPIHAAAKNLIDGDRFGRLLFVEARQSFRVTSDTEAGWRGADPQRTFKEFGTHVLDLCAFFFNEHPQKARVRMPKPTGANGPDLLNIVQLEFSGDRVAQIVLDRLTRGRHRYLDMRLVGEKATIETSIGGRAELSVGVRASDRRPFGLLDIAAGGRARLYEGERFKTIATAPMDLFADATARLFRAFLDAIAHDTVPPNSIEQARRTLKLLYSCYEDVAAGTHE